MQAHLTDSYIARIKTPDSRVELKDTRIPGFTLRVGKRAKVWYFRSKVACTAATSAAGNAAALDKHGFITRYPGHRRKGSWLAAKPKQCLNKHLSTVAQGIHKENPHCNTGIFNCKIKKLMAKPVKAGDAKLKGLPDAYCSYVSQLPATAR